MKKMKTLHQILAFLAALMLICTASVTLTAAFLTDRDSEANVFTVGNVQIDLTEDFSQNSTLIPGVKIKKEPAVTNTGKNDAWVWIDIAIPAALDNDNASLNIVHFNYDKDHVNAAEWNWQSDGKWNVQKNVSIPDDPNLYNVYTVLYGTALKPGETTSPVMTQVYMDTSVDIDPNGDWQVVKGGVSTPVGWNTEDNGPPVIYVSAYAIQREKFDDVRAAYAAYGAQWGDKGTEWGEINTMPDLPSGVSPIMFLDTGGFTDIEWDEELQGWSVVYAAVSDPDNTHSNKQDTTPLIPDWEFTDGTHTGPIVRLGGESGAGPAWENVTSVTFGSGTYYIDEGALPGGITLYVKADTKLEGHRDSSWTVKTYTDEDGSDPDDGEYTTVTTEDELADALQAGGKVRLGGDITTEDTSNVPEGVTVTLDLNGHTLAHQDNDRYYSLTNAGALTITDSADGGKIDGYVLSRGTSLTIKSGTITGDTYSHSATDISGGTFEGSAFFMSDVSISGGSFAWAGPQSNTPISAVISGGSFKEFSAQAPGVSITDGSFDLLWILDDDISISGGKFTGVGAYGTATITGGTFDVFTSRNNDGINISGGSFGALHNTVDTNAGYDIKSVVNITGGTFGKFHNYYVSKNHGDGDIRNGWGVANISGGSFGELINDEGAKAAISGGTFGAKPNDSWLESGYKATESEGKWTVAAG
ncbi:MAG: hypothetical protein IKM31_06745 [Oscillospiraceae bacterium]|nr:hypothetical protein [Oscillospiraceae bacterium]